ncbi:MAG: tryptophan--tRNA ligase [Deltaproteobacteria bacterium]|nr:MAG: tryptophan--tRNA ligase [Deltaproteobacteria bacterium]
MTDTQAAAPKGPRRSLSGIKSTGTPHLGNYLGMIRPAIALQESHEAFYFVADYHALTTERDPVRMRRATHEITATFLACGLDPSHAAFFRQSDVPEVTELTWLLSCVITMGELERAHAFKARKAEGTEGTALHGLFAYPVLMAADIIIYDSHVVPVGKDQVQHVEMARDMAKRFNHIFGDTFVLPEALVREEVMTIPGIDGRKMSKSYDNGIEIFLPKKQLKKRLMQIVTDSTPLEDPKDPDTCNVVSLYKYFATPEQVAEMEAAYRQGGYGYGHAKLALLEALDGHLAPMRDRYEALMADPDTLEDVLRAGAAKARATAREVLGRAREKVGYPRHPFSLA